MRKAITADKYIDMVLLEYRARIEGMVAENKQAEFEGKKMQYLMKDFDRLRKEYYNELRPILEKISKKQ